MEHRRKVFKLIIMPTQNAVQLLQWILKNIGDISTCGVGIRVQKISQDEFDTETVDSFRRRGITSLPALVSPAGKLYIGNTAIISMFSGGLTRARASTRVGELTDTADIDVDDYLSREITGGMRRTPKGLVAPENEDDDEDDIQRKLNEYQRRAPKQHRVRNPAEYETDIPSRPPRRSGGRRPPPPPPEDDYDDYDDYDRNHHKNRDEYDGGDLGVDNEYDEIIFNTLMSNVPTPGG